MVRGKHAKARNGAHAKRADRGLLAKVGYPLAFAALFALAIGPGYAIATEAGIGAAKKEAAPVASAKDETVYVFSKADGSVKNVEVSDKLTNADKSAELADSSTLTDIENAEGDETYSGAGDSMVWNAAGDDIYYRGDSSKELPFAMSVTYKLDGKVASADELVGKSGKVEISYNFQNETEVENGVQVPLAAITGMLFDNETFRDVEVDNGRVVDDGDRVVVIGYAMPGLAKSLGVGADTLDIPSGFTVTAQTTGFEMKSSLTMVTGNLFDSLNLDDLGTGDLSDASGSLKDAMSKLMDGSGKLADGMSTLQDKTSALPGGVKKLADGSSDLADGLDSAVDGTSKLASGAKSLDEGADAVSSGASDLSGALDQISAGTAALADSEKGIPAAIAGIDAIAAQTPEMSEAGIAQLQNAVSDSNLNNTVKAQVNGLLTYAYKAGSGVKSISSKLDGVDAQLEKLAKGASDASAGAKKLAGGAKDLAGGASKLSSGANALNEKLPAAAKGATKLEKGIGSLNASTGSLVSGIEQLADGATKLDDGLAQFNDEGITKITDFLDSDLLQATNNLEAVRDAGAAYTNFSGITPGTSGSVKFIVETDAVEQDD